MHRQASKTKRVSNRPKAKAKANGIRASLLRRGHTITSFAKQNGLPYTSVWQAIYGTRAGTKSRDILEKILNA
jgi:hypothetical protein